VARLVQVNGLPGKGNFIVAGHTLKVPGGASGGGSATSRTRHTVVRGDTLSEIALHYGVGAAAIARANHLPSSNLIRLGQSLYIPGVRRSTSSNSFAGRTYASSVVSAASRNRAILSHRRLPSQGQMRDLIVRKSRANGVDPALALAVSWQESGWGQHHVSVANAIGAMQVVPSTGAWISGVIGRRLDLLDPQDNVTAGVVLLRILTQQANERQAVACCRLLWPRSLRMFRRELTRAAKAVSSCGRALARIFSARAALASSMAATAFSSAGIGSPRCAMPLANRSVASTSSVCDFTSRRKTSLDAGESAWWTKVRLSTER